jgi:anti-anti-sigma regulatory factor
LAQRGYEFDSGVLTFKVDPADMDQDQVELVLKMATHPSIAAPFVDLTVTNYISSNVIGKLTAAASTCLEDGRHMTVLAQKNVAMMLERTGFAKVGIIKKAS